MARDKSGQELRTFDYYMQQGTDFASMEVLMYGANGDFEAVAEHIESGGAICDGLRCFLADVLRGKKRRNNRPRTRKQATKESDIVMRIKLIQVVEEMNGRQCSDNAAMQKFLDLNFDQNDETVRNYVRKARARKHGKKVPTS